MDKCMKLIGSPFTLFLTTLVLLAIVPAAYAAKGPTAAEYGTVLNLSGKQRMLTQKMSKEILLIARKIEIEKNLSNLRKTSHLFDKTLTGLKDGDKELALPPTSDMLIRMQLGKVDILWSRISPLVEEILTQGHVTEDQAWFVAEKNLQLLKEMDNCVKMYEIDAGKAGLKSDPALAVTINLSGKQRMLTQKMSKEFLLIAYGHKVEHNRQKLEGTAKLFEKTLKGLLDGDDSLALPGTEDSEIRQQLDTVNTLWGSFKPLLSIAGKTQSKDIPTEKIIELSSTNLELLSEMNKAVSMYEKQAAARI